MAESTGSAEDRAIDALTKILESAISPDMLQAQQLILRRLALAGDLFPSRIPPPLNITQVGGYLNLIEKDPVLRAQVLSSALGVAGPNPAPGFDPTLPPLYFTSRANDRPTGTAATATPVTIRVRNDLAGPLDAALAALHDQGVTLPLLATDAPLPPVAPGAPPPVNLLPYLGRELQLVPAAGLIDPVVDPLAVGQLGGTGPQLVVSRQLDPTAPAAGSVAPQAWSLWTCDNTMCTQSTVTDAFVDLTAPLNTAGWYRVDPLPAPTSLGADGGWTRWSNTTGLVAGRSTFGEELRLLYSLGQIAASSVRELQDWVWNGTSFAAPV